MGFEKHRRAVTVVMEAAMKVCEGQTLPKTALYVL